MKPLIKFEHPVSSQEKGCGLPLTRASAFKDLLKHHYFRLLEVGASLLVFFIPFFVIFSICNLSFDALWNELEEGAISQTVFIEESLRIYLHELLGFALSFLLLSFPLSFYSRIYRSLCFYEGFFFWREGKKGFRQNFLHLFLSSLLLALFGLGSALLVLYVDFGNANPNWATSILSFLPLTILLLGLFPTFLIFFVMDSIYKTTFWKGVSASFKIYLNSFFPVLGFSLASFLPLLVFLIPNSLIVGSLLLAFILIYYPVLLLGTWLYLLSRFDLFINKENYPSLYQKGLFI